MTADSADTLVAGRYRLDEVLGRGGMGVVWRAVDTLIERTVALKELRAPKGDESSFVERALREARNAGRLSHPGIVAVHDVIAPTGDDDAVYIVMEYVEAPSLAEVIDQNGPLPPDRVAAMGLGILDALTAAHSLGIVHRDIKPGNVLVPDGDRVKLTDFGIALAAEDARLTRSGIMGTHAYLAPECFDDGHVGPATDLWALGATLFHAVAGRAPFERETTTATLRAILFEEPPPPPCGPPLADAITGLLTRPVGQRLASGAARQLLHHAAATAPAPAPPLPPAGPDRPAWQAQATTTHRPPTPTPAPGPPPPHTTHPGGRPSPHTTLPGGPPSPYVTGRSAPPPHPPGPHPPTGPVHAPPPAGPPSRRNNTPIVLGVLAAVATVVLVVILASSGGSDSDSGGSEGGSVAGQTPGAGQAQLPGQGSAPGENPVPPADPALADGQALAQEFLDLVHSGDSAAAIAMLCTEGVDNTQDYADNVTEVAGDAALQIDPGTAELVSQGVVYSVDLTGTVHGQSVSSAHVAAAARDGCIVTFSARSD